MKNYWFCKIGPIEAEKLPFGADGPLRSVVIEKFSAMLGQHPTVCSSGWGLTEEMKTRLDIISFLPTTDKSGEILKEIDKILERRPM